MINIETHKQSKDKESSIPHYLLLRLRDHHKRRNGKAEVRRTGVKQYLDMSGHSTYELKAAMTACPRSSQSTL